MIKNYLKIAFRQLLRNKSFSIINISGLAIGMAAVILILLWIQNEVSYDQFHSKKDRIYELWNRGEYSGELNCWNTTPKCAAKIMKQDIPEIEKAVRVNWTISYLLSAGNKKLSLMGTAVDKEFLDVFDFPLLKGNPKTVLADGKSILLTASCAEKLFGKENPIGKTLVVNNTDNVIVTGIISNPPVNTRFNFEFLLSWNYLLKSEPEDENWGNNSSRNYVLLKENASFERAQAKVKDLRKKYQDPKDAMEMFFYPMEHWRLYSNFENGIETGGRIEYVRLFGIIAGFILLIACINFMNLSTARSEKRAKEVGIRKTVGAMRSSLVRQFLGESVIIVMISFVMALLIVQVSLPSFNTLIGKKLFIDYSNIYFWLFSLVFILVTGFLAGSYPAFFLSSFKPVKVLKGTFKAANALITPRKILVVIQFSFAIVLIVCTLIVRQQINHVQQRETGYNKDNLIYVFLNGDIEKNYALIKNELLSGGIATSLCKTSSPLTQGWSDTWGFGWKGKDPNDKTDFDRYGTDEGIVETAGLELVKGRDMDLKRFPTDSTAVLLNESAVKVMGFKEPIGETVNDNDVDWHVIGVVKDFILHSPYYPTKPMVIEGCKTHWINVVNIKFNAKNLTTYNLKKTENIFKKYNPAFPFQYSFVNEEYEQKFENEKRTSALATLFAALTIFISCLGLFGLSTYMAENRIKEIGIRKVLGASVANITTLLSLNFLKLVLISFLIATPLAWWFMHNWLSDYPYHITIRSWVFIIAGIASLLISLLTISFQAIKAAVANPVKNLRTE